MFEITIKRLVPRENEPRYTDEVEIYKQKAENIDLWAIIQAFNKEEYLPPPPKAF